MKKRILLILFFISLLSCEYKREQTLPKNVEVKSDNKLCYFNIYQLTVKYLSGIEKTSIQQWEDGLICEGYNDTLKFSWTEYYSLKFEYKNELTYYLKNLETCLKEEISLENIWIAACLTKLKDSSGTRFNFHKIFILDKNKSILYEISNLN